MGAAIGDVLGLAAGVAVSPLPIVAIHHPDVGHGQGPGYPAPSRRWPWPCSCSSGRQGCSPPWVLYLAAGERAANTLESWKTWAGTHNAAIMTVLFLVFGFKLVGDGIAVLS
jgi:hypothetical protein